MMLEALELVPGQNVLEIGTGSGYHAALCAEAITVAKKPLDKEFEGLLPELIDEAPESTGAIPEGHVYTVERIEDLVESARKNLLDAGYSDLVTVIPSDGTQGYEPEAPYERILVTAAAPKVPPKLVTQLAPNGILVIPVGKLHYHQKLQRIRKSSSGHVSIENLCSVVFVPLIGKNGWPQ
jgi:protein-L-isoaspartate(D-aspartate) O-methyltransferase